MRGGWQCCCQDHPTGGFPHQKVYYPVVAMLIGSFTYCTVGSTLYPYPYHFLPNPSQLKVAYIQATQIIRHTAENCPPHKVNKYSLLSSQQNMYRETVKMGCQNKPMVWKLALNGDHTNIHLLHKNAATVLRQSQISTVSQVNLDGHCHWF